MSTSITSELIVVEEFDRKQAKVVIRALGSGKSAHFRDSDNLATLHCFGHSGTPVEEVAFVDNQEIY